MAPGIFPRRNAHQLLENCQPELAAKLLAERGSKKTAKEIASEVGLSPRAVRNFFNRHGGRPKEVVSGIRQVASRKGNGVKKEFLGREHQTVLGNAYRHLLKKYKDMPPQEIISIYPEVLADFAEAEAEKRRIMASSHNEREITKAIMAANTARNRLNALNATIKIKNIKLE